jgi:hypothetical protein
MKTKLFFITVMVSALANFTMAQVGVGTTTPNGALDVSSSTQGLIPPRVVLTSAIVQAPVINPQGGAIVEGTVVYNTATNGVSPNNVGPGLYFWNGSRWIAFAGSPGGLDWSLAGNSGTTAGTNFLGTTDAQGLRFHTNGAERGRFGATGRYGLNSNDQTFAQFFSYSTDNTIDALVGYSAVDGGTGVYGRSQGTGGVGLYASNNSTGGWGVYGYNSNATSGVGNVGQSAGTTGTGVVGLANGTSYSTLTGYAQGVAGTGSIGVYGMSTGTVAAQRYGGYFSYDMDNDLATSDANSPLAILAGRGNNFLGAGAANTIYFGGYFSGGQDNTAATPNTAADTNGNGGNTADFAYVGAQWGGTNYKILGNGTVSTIIDGEGEDKHIMFAPEAPEMLFQDYGVGKLVNGKAQIKIDPILAKNIVINEKHPLKVFIQLEGDCNGVYVTNKTQEGFVVKELQNGNSNVSFSYQIVATRADRTDSEGNVLSKNADVRLPIAPDALERIKTTVHETKKVEDKKIETEKK